MKHSRTIMCLICLLTVFGCGLRDRPQKDAHSSEERVQKEKGGKSKGTVKASSSIGRSTKPGTNQTKSGVTKTSVTKTAEGGGNAMPTPEQSQEQNPNLSDEELRERLIDSMLREHESSAP